MEACRRLLLYSTYAGSITALVVARTTPGTLSTTTYRRVLSGWRPFHSVGEARGRSRGILGLMFRWLQGME